MSKLVMMGHFGQVRGSITECTCRNDSWPVTVVLSIFTVSGKLLGILSMSAIRCSEVSVQLHL